MRKFPVLIAAIALPVLVASCSSSDDSTKTTETSVVSETTTETTEVTEDVTEVTEETVETTVTAAGDHPEQYVGSWMGHTRTLDLAADGSGTVKASQGAVNWEVWSLTWTGNQDEVTVTLGTETETEGAGVDFADLREGAVSTGTITEANGGYILTVDGVKFCDAEVAGPRGDCGA